LRGEELIGPVGVRRGAGHRDVAGAQLVGEVGQHARLQVPAHEHARPGPVADGLVPVLRRERRVEDPHPLLTGVRVQDRAAVAVEERDPVGDVVAGQHGVLAHEVQ
jgi:hypothetical protein